MGVNQDPKGKTLRYNEICSYKFYRELAAIQLGLVQGLKSALAALSSLKLNNTTTFTSSVFILKNVDADNFACLAHVILKVFPLGLPVEIRDKNSTAPHRLLVVKQVALVEHLAPDKLAILVLLFVALLSKITTPRYNQNITAYFAIFW